jgi:class 3 adenylate cyclase
MFREATVWELRLGKIASVVFSGLFVFLLISNLKNFGRDDWWHLTIDYSTYVSGFIFYSVIFSSWLFFKNPQREAKYYPFALLISILLLNWLFFINFHLMTPPITEVTDPRYFETLGRRLYYIFVPMPLILMFALLHLRVWAVILFLLLAISPQLLKLFWVINHPRTFYASNLQDLNNAAALDAGFIWFNAVVCIVALCAMFGLLFFNNYALKTAQRIERTNTLLGRYFAPEVRQEIETLEMDLTKQESKEQDVAIIFTDIVGFTNLSEKMHPREVMQLLSKYQSLMVDAIFANNGTVDKFIGDAVMANFGTPQSHGNDAQNAFDCALEMQRKMVEWNISRRAEGLPEVTHRIGIHCGSCVVGNVGSEQRLEFAVVGDVVNVASRICDAGKTIGSDFVISADLFNRLETNENFQKIKNFQIRGRKEPIDLMAR